MLQVLVESRAAIPRRASWTAVSIVAHSAVIAGAIYLTATAAPDLPDEVLEQKIFYVAPPVLQPAASDAPAYAAASIIIPRTVLAIPAIIPPPIATPGPDFLHRVLEDLTRTTVGTITGGNPGGTVVPGGIHTAETVDRVVMPLPGNASPVYPSRLSGAGVEGDVSVRFVVDTTGRVEPSSVEILQASHALFGEEVKQWLKRTRYAPATVNGRRVRQLVGQRIGFTLTR